MSTQEEDRENQQKYAENFAARGGKTVPFRPISEGNGRDAIISEINQKRGVSRDCRLIQSNDLGAIGRTFARAFPKIAQNKELWEEARDMVNESLNYGDVENDWALYRSVGLEVYQNNNLSTDDLPQEPQWPRDVVKRVTDIHRMRVSRMNYRPGGDLLED